MDFRLSPAQRALRDEVRAWLRATLGPNWVGEDADVVDQDWQTALWFNRQLARRGWLVPAWPMEYGGQGWSPVEQLILTEELVYARAPAGARLFGVHMVGPTLILHGTQEQKRRFLPPIARGEVVWCQGFSEPGAGSDLASLQTRAVRDGDDYVINGQKIWTTAGHRADWMILLARTDPDAPKHRGITYFLVDMTSPGITVRPLINMVGRHEFNEVFFENVRVPAENVVGEVNRGWYVATTTLDLERSSIAAMANGRRMLDDLLAFCRAERWDGLRLIDHPRVRPVLADLHIGVEVGRLFSYRVAWLQAQGRVPNVEASQAKLFAAELSQKVAQGGMRVLALYGPLREGSPWARIGGRFATHYLWTVSQTYAGGSVEIQRQIIAVRGLGLPRG
jgi:alkylation response protein AidB-like acyl-CoA dehydrogenase